MCERERECSFVWIRERERAIYCIVMFEMRIHKRVIDLHSGAAETVKQIVSYQLQSLPLTLFLFLILTQHNYAHIQVFSLGYL